MLDLPELGVANVPTARRSLRVLEAWVAIISLVDALSARISEAVAAAKFHIDNMRFMNAQKSPVMRAKAEEAIAALREAVGG